MSEPVEAFSPYRYVYSLAFLIPSRKLWRHSEDDHESNGCAPREVLELFVTLVELNALAVELFLEDEFTIRVLSRLELTSGVKPAPGAMHGLDDVLEVGVGTPAQHRTEFLHQLHHFGLGSRVKLRIRTWGFRCGDSGKTHLFRNAIVGVVEVVANLHDVGARVEDAHRVRVQAVEDGLLADTNLQI